MTLTYICKHPETRLIAKGVRVEYNGELLVIVAGHSLTAITANPGESVTFKLAGKEIAATGVQVRMAAKGKQPTLTI